MTEKDSQGKKGWHLKDILSFVFIFVPLFVFAIVVIVFSLSALGSPLAWASDNIPKKLEVAIAVLTILVTVVAVIMGLITWWTRKEWNEYKEKNLKGVASRLHRLEGSLKEVEYLQKHIKTDPLLESDKDREQLLDFAKGFSDKQDMLSLQNYLAGRAYKIGYDRTISIEAQLEKSIQHYRTALIYAMGSEMRRRIYQAMGFSLSELGDKYFEKDQPEAKEYYEKAETAFHEANKAEHSSQALDSQGNACINLAKMASDQERKTELFTKAIKCFDGAIQMKDSQVQRWWATFHFDKARALALSAGLVRADEEKPKDLDEVADEVGKELTKAIDKVVPEPVGFDDLDEVLQDFENVEAYDTIKELLNNLRQAIRKARQG